MDALEVANLAADIKRRVRRARIIAAAKSIGLTLGGLVLIALMVGSCFFGQISCQARLNAQGVPFGDERMEACFN